MSPVAMRGFRNADAGKALIAALVGGAAYPSDSEAMYVGAKPTELGAFSSLMDRMVRKEIPDVPIGLSNLRKLETSLRAGKGEMLGDIYPHKELFSQYPEMKDIPVRLKDSPGGQYISPNALSSTGMIRLHEKPRLSDLLHEIQHAIQEKEGWAKGGSPEEFKKGWQWPESDRLAAQDEVHAKFRVKEYFEKAEKLGITPQEVIAKESKTWGFDTTTPRIRELLGAYDSAAEAKKYWLESKNQLDAYLKRAIYDPSTTYRNLAGEIESRDTAARMGMSAAERSRTATYSSENIPLNDVIVKGVNPQKLAYGVGGAGLLSMMAQPAQAGPTIENLRQRMVQQYEGGGLQEPAFDPITLLSGPAKWGGGAANLTFDTLMKLLMGQ